MYFLKTRYYDPKIGRFITIDDIAYLSFVIVNGLNLYAYCVDNPITSCDITGTFFAEIGSFFQTVGAEIANAFKVVSPAYVAAAGASVVDGPIPIGDIVGVVIAGGATIAALVIGTIGAVKINEQSKVKAEGKDKTAIPPSNGVTYYHVTTMENATAIMNSCVMVGSSWEGGYVYAWKFKPNKYAIENSGAHKGVIISFKTTASFTLDPGIDDPLVVMYGPVVSATPGPIAVWDVKIVG